MQIHKKSGGFRPRFSLFCQILLPQTEEFFRPRFLRTREVLEKIPHTKLQPLFVGNRCSKRVVATVERTQVKNEPKRRF